MSQSRERYWRADFRIELMKGIIKIATQKNLRTSTGTVYGSGPAGEMHVWLPTGFPGSPGSLAILDLAILDGAVACSPRFIFRSSLFQLLFILSLPLLTFCVLSDSKLCYVCITAVRGRACVSLNLIASRRIPVTMGSASIKKRVHLPGAASSTATYKYLHTYIYSEKKTRD